MTRKIALITGGSRGLGRSMALHLADKGRDVVISYRSKEREAHEVVAQIESKGGKAAALQLDTGSVSSFDSFVARLRAVLREKWNRADFDFLVNNAGVALHPRSPRRPKLSLTRS